MGDVPLLPFALLLPLLLLALALAMERVERPLRLDAVTERLAGVLDTARPEEVEALVRDGYDDALEGYWRRQRLARLLPGRVR